MLGAAPLLLGIFGGAVLKQGVGVMLDGEDVAVAHQHTWAPTFFQRGGRIPQN